MVGKFHRVTVESDAVEALETVSIRAQGDDGSFLPLESFDDVPSYA